MFKIKIRIVDDTESINELKQITPALFDDEYQNIYGYFQIELDNGFIGFCHENPIKDGELGGQLLNYWLGTLTDAVYYLPKTKYIAFSVLGGECWIELNLLNKKEVLLKSAEWKTKKICGSSKSFTTTKDIDFVYEKQEFIFGLDNMKSEVLRASEEFFKEIVELNPALIETQMAKNLLVKIDMIR